MSVAYPSYSGPGTGVLMTRRNVFLVWLVWPFLTLGIYHFVWWYKVNAEVRRFDQRIQVSPAVAVIAILFGGAIVVPPFVSIYNTGKRIAAAQHSAGVGASCNGVIGIVLAFVFGLHSLYYQSELNKIPDRYRQPEGTVVPLAA